MAQDTNQVPPMTGQLNIATFREIVALRGWKTNAETARNIGVSPQQLKRILAEEQEPTMRFACGFLHYTRIAGFRRTFNIVPATDTNEEVNTP